MVRTGRVHRSFPFLPPRRLHNEAKKPKAGLSSQLSVAKFQRARTPVRLRESNKGAQTRRCNLTEERMVVPPTSRWCLLDRYHITLIARSRAISSSSRSSKTFVALSRKNYCLFFFTLYGIYGRVVPIEISENCKAIRQHETATWKSAKPSNLRCLSAGCY